MDAASESNTIRRPSKPIDPVGTAMRHWLKILVLGGVLFLLLIPLAFMFTQPYYLAIGKLRISPAMATFIARFEETPITPYYKDYVRTQVDRIQEPDILKKALDKLPADLKPLFVLRGLSPFSAATVLGKRLKVKHIIGTHLILLNLSGTSSRGLAEVINNVMEVYLEKLRTEEEGKDHRRLTYLNREKERIDNDILRHEKLYKEIAESIETSTFSELYNIHNDQVSALQKAYVAAYANRSAKENLLMAAKREAAFLKGISLEPLVDEMVEKDESLWDTAWWTYKTLQEMRASLDGVTEDNPDRKYVEERMKGMSKYLGKLRAEVRERAHRIIYEKRDVEIKQKIIQAEAAFEAAKEEETEIREELNRAKTESAKTSQNMLEGQQVETALKSLRELVKRIGDRITELKLESRAPGRVSLESRARMPVFPAGSNFKKLFVVVFMLSFGLIIVICFLFDLQDNRVRTRKDVVNALSAPPTWPISDYLVTGERGIPFSRVTLDDPSNVVSRAIRSLAVRLDKEREEHSAKVAVVTGVDDKSGVTEILLNTAHAMAMICGKVLVIEWNFLHPNLGRLVEAEEGKKGLVDFLAGESDISKCITHDPERDIDLLLAGDVPEHGEPALFDRSRVLQMLKTIREQYQFILLDTVPLPVSDLTEFLAVHADIAVLVIQGDRSFYKNLYLSGDVLIKLEIPAIAPVLNWGAPRFRSKGQKVVSNILGPVQRWLKGPSQRKPLLDRIRRVKFPGVKSFLFLAVLGIAAALTVSFAAKTRAPVLFKGGEGEEQTEKVSGGVKARQKSPKLVEPKKMDANQTAGDIHTGGNITAKSDEKGLVRSFQIKIVKKVPSPIKKDEGPPEKQGIPLALFPEQEDLDDFFEADVFAASAGDVSSEGAADPETATASVENKKGEFKEEPWILGQKPWAFTIQLLGVENRASLVEFARNHGLKGNIAYFYRKRGRRDWYSLIYGLYPDKVSALKELGRLPERLRESGPWVRSFGSIQRDISGKADVG